MKKYLGIVLCAAVWVLIGMESSAQIQIGGLLRDEYALGLTTSIKSAGMGGAYLGVDRVDSMNPAAIGGIEGIEGTLGYRAYDHDRGPTAHRGTLGVTFHDPVSDYVAGWFPWLEFLKTGANRVLVDGFITDGKENTRLSDGAGNPLAADYYDITLGMHYGVDVFDWLALGFGSYPYESGHIILTSPGNEMRGDALSQVGSTQLGTIIKPCQYFNDGAEFIYIKDDLEVSGTGGHLGDMYYIHYVGAGVAVMPFAGTLIAVDYWNGEMEGAVNNTVKFDQDVDRWNVGVEQRVCKYVDLRAGSNNGGLTAGLTFHINDTMEVDYAYVNKALRDKENVFGDTQYHGLAFTMRF